MSDVKGRRAIDAMGYRRSGGARQGDPRCGRASRGLDDRRADCKTATERWGRVVVGQAEWRKYSRGRQERRYAFVQFGWGEPVRRYFSPTGGVPSRAGRWSRMVRNWRLLNAVVRTGIRRSGEFLGLPRSLKGTAVREIAMDRNRMLLVGSAVVLVLLIAYMMFGPGGPSVPR